MGELLTWFGNFINFLILTYFFTNLIFTTCFNQNHIWIGLGGVVVGILIQTYNLFEKKW